LAAYWGTRSRLKTESHKQSTPLAGLDGAYRLDLDISNHRYATAAPLHNSTANQDGYTPHRLPCITSVTI